MMANRADPPIDLALSSTWDVQLQKTDARIDANAWIPGDRRLCRRHQSAWRQRQRTRTSTSLAKQVGSSDVIEQATSHWFMPAMTLPSCPINDKDLPHEADRRPKQLRRRSRCAAFALESWAPNRCEVPLPWPGQRT